MPKSSAATGPRGQRRRQQPADGAALALDAPQQVEDGAPESNDEAVAEGGLGDFPEDLVAELAELIAEDERMDGSYTPTAAAPQDGEAAPGAQG